MAKIYGIFYVCVICIVAFLITRIGSEERAWIAQQQKADTVRADKIDEAMIIIGIPIAKLMAKLESISQQSGCKSPACIIEPTKVTLKTGRSNEKLAIDIPVTSERDFKTANGRTTVKISPVVGEINSLETTSKINISIFISNPAEKDPVTQALMLGIAHAFEYPDDLTKRCWPKSYADNKFGDWRCDYNDRGNHLTVSWYKTYQWATKLK